jgi:hypothetical protein
VFLEIFKSGVHTDSDGISGEFSNENLSLLSEKYQKRINDNPDDLAPVVAGHPKSEDGAKGWVRKIFRRGNTLVADVEFVDKLFFESIKSGEYKNVSIAIDSDFNFIHLGFLGSVPPAVEGLSPLKYSAVSEFEFYDNNSKKVVEYEIQLLDKIKELENKNKIFSNSIEEYEKKLRKIEFDSIIDSEISKSGTNNITNYQKNIFSDILELAYRLDKSENSGSSNFEKVKLFISEFTKIKKSNEFSTLLNPVIYNTSIESNIEPKRNSLHNRVLAILNENPSYSYEDALLLTDL